MFVYVALMLVHVARGHLDNTNFLSIQPFTVQSWEFPTSDQLTITELTLQLGVA